jgi:hypothetical protein
MPSKRIAAAMLCRSALILSAVSLSTSSQAIEMAEFGLESCFERNNPTALVASDTTLLAVATDPAFERKLCQIDTEIPIHSFAGHVVLPDRTWLIVTHAGLYAFKPSGTVVPLQISDAVGATGAAIGANGRVTITTNDHIAILDMRTGFIDRLLHAAGNNRPYVLPYGTMLAGRDDTVVQLNTETGEEIRAINVGTDVTEIKRRADDIIVVKTLSEVILYDEDLLEYARFAAPQRSSPCLLPRRSGSRC